MLSYWLASKGKHKMQRDKAAVASLLPKRILCATKYGTKQRLVCVLKACLVNFCTCSDLVGAGLFTLVESKARVTSPCLWRPGGQVYRCKVCATLVKTNTDFSCIMVKAYVNC